MTQLPVPQLPQTVPWRQPVCLAAASLQQQGMSFQRRSAGRKRQAFLFSFRTPSGTAYSFARTKAVAQGQRQLGLLCQARRVLSIWMFLSTASRPLFRCLHPSHCAGAAPARAPAPAAPRACASAPTSPAPSATPPSAPPPAVVQFKLSCCTRRYQAEGQPAFRTATCTPEDLIVKSRSLPNLWYSECQVLQHYPEYPKFPEPSCALPAGRR